jgi:hypothetical protein
MLFPTLTLRKYGETLAAAADRLGYSFLGLTPHMIRHSGPSNDRFENRRTLLAVQKRGRWAMSKSVNRYEKHARLLRQIHRLSPEQQLRAKAVSFNIRLKFLSRF